jgi:hypothetical protein
VTTSGSWYSQRFRPDGGITADGLRNQLGRPNLSRLTVLVREAAQNSWDARVGDHVDFRLDLVSVPEERISHWRRLLAESRPGPHRELSLGDLLERGKIAYLAVSDRGTEGLTGPTRSDVYAPPGRRNWLSFVLNSGDKQDTVGGGGTYGYGKGAFYVASLAQTVLIHTRFVDDEGGLTTRLIGASLGSSFSRDGVPYTGRHWWGLAEPDHCEPLVNDAAGAVAQALGLPAFDDDQTGTTVVVLAPDLRDPVAGDVESPRELTHEEAARFLADAAGWSLWPLTLPDRAQRMSISVNADGRPVTVPHPGNDSVLKNFAAAYRGACGPDAEAVTYGQAKTLLGKLGHADTFGVSVDSPAAKELGLAGAPHHIALMRQPDLIVRYLEGPAKQHPTVGYAGVFKAADEHDKIFAKSEPPTHDSWNFSQLQGRDASYVRVAQRRLTEACRGFAGLASSSLPVSAVSTSSLARRLGHLLAGAATGNPNDGVGSGPRSLGGGSGGGGGNAGGRRRPLLQGLPSFDDLEGRTVLRQRVAFPSGGPHVALCAVVTGDGAAETSAPAGAPSPRVIGWLGADGILTEGSALTAIDGQEVDLLVEPVADAAVEISVKAES